MDSRIILYLVLAAFLIAGCTSTRYVTNSSRSSTEQLLLSTALNRAVSKLAWPDIRGHKVALDVVSFAPEDEAYIRVILEVHSRSLGATVVPATGADMVILGIIEAFGTASRDSQVGIPSMPLVPGVATPAIIFSSTLKQRGYAKIRLHAYRDSGAHFDGQAVLERAKFQIRNFIFTIHQNDIYPDEGFGVGLD